MSHYQCQLRSCGFNVAGPADEVDEAMFEHEQMHLDQADEMTIEEVDEITIVDEQLADVGGGGVRAILDFTTKHGRFGEATSAEYHVMFRKPHGAVNDAGIPVYLLPQLIDELQRMHGVYTRRMASGNEMAAEKAGTEDAR